METAKYIKHKIYSDKVIELFVICPYCSKKNIHTITNEYITKLYKPRTCLTLTCNDYNLPKILNN
jgi:thymidine kinase